MWEKPELQTATAVARPIRVAYLVDAENCPMPLLDAVFAECYGRWGGRRTLIVPAKAEGVDLRYSEWLHYFDPDVVYSFVQLGKDALATFHERYAPAYLVKHQEGIRSKDEEPSYYINLPLHGVTSLSVLPAFASHHRAFDGPPRNVKLLDKYWDRSASPFIQENFGFLSSTFSTSAIATAHPDVFNCTTLITEAALNDPRMGKDKQASYVTSEDAVLEELGSPGGPLTLAQLSEFYTPYLDPGDGTRPGGTTIVVGDSAADRILFWNIHHRYPRGGLSDITALRIPTARMNDQAFIGRLRQLIERRGVRGHNGQTDKVILYSISLDEEQLAPFARCLQKIGHWLDVDIKRQLDYAGIVPRFRNTDRVRFHRGGAFAEPESRVTSEYSGKRFTVPMAVPWHFREKLPPSSLRQGHWMVDVIAERHIDHCRYVNQRHIWTLPRRLRLERTFTIEREGGRDDHQGRFIRPMRGGAMGLALHIGLTRVAVTVPEDLQAFQSALCNDVEWLPFEQFRDKQPYARTRFAYAALSDKGRYLLGVLALFETLPDAFEVLMDAYWGDVLKALGAEPAEKNGEAKAQLLRTLHKRLGRHQGGLTFQTDEQLDRLGREALRAGRMIAREQRYIAYAGLHRKWENLVAQFVEKNPRPDDQVDDADASDTRHLDQSIQHLCAREVLFQGREWQCQNCYNRNWVSLDAMRRRLVCTVCRHDEPAPVAGDWHFRANPFIVEAYREHGCKAVIWALWQLSRQARDSFYFMPSVRLWLERPKNSDDKWDAEIDAVAVVDSKVYAIEAKSSSGIDENEIGHLVLAAERIRPDVMAVASMEAENDAWRRAMARLKSRLPAGTALETLHFSKEELNDDPWLPA